MLSLIGSHRLSERPFHACASEDGRRFAACAKSGRVQIFDEDLTLLQEADLGGGVQWISFDRTGSLLLVTFRDRIAGFNTVGGMTPRFELRTRGASSASSVLVDDETLCIATWDQTPLLTAWDLGSASRIDEVALPQSGGGGYMLSLHPEGEALALVAYSGQCEDWLYWGHYSSGTLRVFTEPEIEDVAFPQFHPSGREFVSYDNFHGFSRRDFPSGRLLASAAPAEVFPEAPEDAFSYDAIFHRDDRFLVWQCDLALYEFDLETLRPTATILAGIDGRRFGEGGFFSGLSWPLADRRILTSDHQSRKAPLDEEYTLRLWDASRLWGETSTADASRPYTRQLLSFAR